MIASIAGGFNAFSSGAAKAPDASVDYDSYQISDYDLLITLQEPANQNGDEKQIATMELKIMGDPIEGINVDYEYPGESGSYWLQINGYMQVTPEYHSATQTTFYSNFNEIKEYVISAGDRAKETVIAGKPTVIQIHDDKNVLEPWSSTESDVNYVKDVTYYITY